MTDLHIHTTYCDGKNSPEEYVLEGGFSERQKNMLTFGGLLNYTGANK